MIIVLAGLDESEVTCQRGWESSREIGNKMTTLASSDAALETIRYYGSAGWTQAVQRFVSSAGMLIEIYQHSRDRRRIPVCLESGISFFHPPFEPGRPQRACGGSSFRSVISDSFLDEGTLL